jgi:hypothetical protein
MVREEPCTTEEPTVTAATLMLARPAATTTGGEPATRADAVVSPLDAVAAVLSVSCALQLRAIAHRGGPSPEEHVEELRRMLVRREGARAGLARRRQIRHAITAAVDGRPGAIAPGERQALVRDLRELERALAPAARVGTRTVGIPATSATTDGASAPEPQLGG